MTASSGYGNEVSEAIMKMLEGTGWYSPDYTFAEPFIYGKNAGCNYMTDDCIDKTTKTANYDTFCDVLGGTKCTFDHKGFGVCNTNSNP